MPVERTPRSIARWLLLAATALIAYGSLYPFDFSAPGGTLPAALAGLGFRRPSRGDLVANLLLYAPLGMALVPALGWRSRSGTLLAATLAGAALSAGIEGLQLLLPARVASLTDVVLNTASAAAGAAVALAWGAAGRGLRIPGLRGARPELVPSAVLALWLGFRLAPFVPTIDWQKYKDALKPLVRWEDFGWLSTARYAAGWLVAFHALRLLLRPPARAIATLALPALVLAAQVGIVTRTLRTTEVAGIAAALAATAALSRLRDAQVVPALLALVTVVVVASGLEPFTFVVTPGKFSWLPFRNSLSDSLELNLAALLEKAFFYGALLWLLGLAGLRPLAAALLVAPLLGLLEFAQRWLPGRSADVTDPLLALGLAALLALAARADAPDGADRAAGNPR